MGQCAICGQNRKLTKEHIPPQSAYINDEVLLMYVDKYAIESGEIRWKGKKRKGGLIRKVLCEECNTKTGGWYGTAYVDFTKQIAPHADSNHVGSIVTKSLQIYPARVAKQALSMFCSTCGPAFADTYPEVRKRILDKYSRGKLGRFRLWLYIRSTKGGIVTGKTAFLDVVTSHINVISEVSFWPAGWILTFEGDKVPNSLEVTHWLDYTFDQELNMLVSLPCNWKVTMYPMDFRSPNQIEKSLLEQR